MINFKLATLNLKSKKFKYTIIFILIMIMSITLFASNTLLVSMKNGIETSKNKLGADIIITPSKYEETAQNALFNGEICTLTMNKNWEDKVKEIDGVKNVSSELYLATLPGASCCDGMIQLIAIDPNNDFLITPWLEKSNMQGLKDDEIILGYNFKIKPGEKIKYYNREFTVVANMDETGLGYDASAFISYEAADKIIKDKSHNGKFDFDSSFDVASMIFIRTEENADPAVVKELITARFGNSEIMPYSTSGKFSEFSKEMNSFKTFAIFMDVLLIIVIIISLLAIETITTVQRRNEIGSMYTVGISKNRIIKIFTIEYLIVSLVAIIISIVVTELIFVFFHEWIRSLFNMPIIIPGVGDTAFMLVKQILLSLVIMIISLSSSFIWIKKESPADMIKEVN